MSCALPFFNYSVFACLYLDEEDNLSEDQQQQNDQIQDEQSTNENRSAQIVDEMSIAKEISNVHA